METVKRGSKGEAVKTLQIALKVYPDGIFGQLTEEALTGFQRANNLIPDGIAGPKTWAVIEGLITKGGAGASVIIDGAAIKRSKRSITDIVVHCSATKEGQAVTVGQIREWHLARGFSDIGYHYFIDLEGKIHLGRDVDLSGAHLLGKNSRSVGVCYAGGLGKDGKPADTRTPAQKKGLENLIWRLKQFYPKAVVKGHRDYSPDLNGNGLIEPREWIKACPCFDAAKEYENL